MREKVELIKPGMFGIAVAADVRRREFDILNEQLLYTDKEIDYLFIGDSITMLWDLNAYFKTDKYIGNRGIGGDNSTYLLKRLEADCIQLHPGNVIIMIGTNDITRTEDDLGWREKGEDMVDVLNEYKSNIVQMIAKCDAAGINVILCSVIPSKSTPPYNRVRRWKMTSQMNEFLRSLGRIYVDYHSVLTEDGRSLPDTLSWDGIHPNAKAYALMAEKLMEVIEI